MKFAENDRFDCVVRLALLNCGDRDVAMFNAIDDSQVVLSPRLNKRIHRLIAQHAREEMFAPSRRVAVRIIVAAMLILSLSCVAMLSISGVREAIRRVIVSWYEDYLTIEYFVDENDTTTTSSGEETEKNIYSAFPNPKGNCTDECACSSDGTTAPTKPIPTQIEEVRKPTYQIPGVELEEDVVCNNASTVNIDYYHGDDYIYSFSQYVLKRSQKYFDSENAMLSEFDLNGYEAQMITYKNKPEVYIVWSDGEYMYVLLSPVLSGAELTDIAKSVKAVSNS